MERTRGKGVRLLHKSLENGLLKGAGAGLVQSQERPESSLVWGFSAMKLQLRSN